jgi:hypothetical protein
MYIAQADVLNDVRVNLRLLKDLLQQRVDHKVKLCILHATFNCLRQRRSDGTGNHYIICVL